MKIFHLCETLKGGIATHLNSLARRQVEDYPDAEITVLCPAHHAEYVDAPGVEIIPFQHRGRGPLAIAKLWWEWAGLVRQHQPDLLHLHSTFAGLIGRTIPHAGRTIYNAHGWSFTTNASPLKKRVYQTIERMLSARGDAIIVISRSELDAAVDAGIDRDKCSLVYNGIEDRPARPASGSVDGPVSALFVGRLDEQKGYDVLIDAFRMLGDKDLRLVVVGEAVQSEKRALDLPGNVTAHGWMAHDELDALIADSDVLVVPSRWEGFGLVAIEAMREGKPVVAHNVGGLPEIVADQQTGLLFSPLDAPTLAGVLGGLDKQRLRDMGKAARRRFETVFTDRAMYAATDRIYRRVLPAYLFERGTPMIPVAVPLEAQREERDRAA